MAVFGQGSLGQFFRLGFVLLRALPAGWGTDGAIVQPCHVGANRRRGGSRCPRPVLRLSAGPRCSRVPQGFGRSLRPAIACRRGVVNLARLQGLEFEKPHVEPGSSEVTGVTVIKRQGKKPSLSAVFYNKELRLRQTRQRKGLPELKEATVIENVRLDVTLHSLGVMAVVRRARRWLKTLMKDFAVFERFPVAKFLAGATKSTVWALERAIRVLSLQSQRGKTAARVISDWLVPYVLQDALRLDVVTGFTVEGYEAFLLSKDRVAVAWRAAKPSDIKVSDDPESDEKNWATFLAEKAGVSLQTVYSRQKAWIAGHGIDISLPNAFYYGVLYYGPNSVATPKDQQATLAAHSDRDAIGSCGCETGRRRTSIGCASMWSARPSARRCTRCQSRWPTCDRRRGCSGPPERSSAAIGVSALAEPAGFRLSPPKAPAPAPSGVIASRVRRR